MRLTSIALTAAALFAALPAQASTMPTLEQIRSAVQAGVAKTQAKMQSSMPFAIKVTSLQGCQQSQEVPGEVVCLVGMSAGMRDAFNVLPLRDEGGTWVGVERKDAKFAGPSPAEAQAMIRAWAKEEVARNPEAAKDVQMQEAQSTMQVTAINECEVKRKTGYLVCDTQLSVPSRPDGIKTELTFMLESAGWRYVPR
ncbi:hypothetical protein IGS59_15570 [Janthinobacterium sp. GW460P]|uniref:hypothetical protein n=1 Tax=unclassified Janthinobacterium TaxID=2610881 RepID=UPI000A324D63|nr:MULTISPECIES: hypothetical protein [unclassified Janthinobacterium]MCC7703667.1 hypothetical protein [Janthinobacterium sp. GW460P]MCC7709373.1 hypothetical protein [Janthinobacterium sp. GW460W]